MRRLHNESFFLVLLWHAVVALMLALSAGCGGSRFLELPTGDPPDTSNCSEATRTFGSKLPWTPWPFPFEGKRTISMSTWKPEHWDDFSGRVHLMEASWDIRWVDSMRMSLGDYPSVAIWDGRRWDVEPRIDLKPYIDADGDRLRIKPFIYAKGVKPAGEPRVAVSIRVALCGPGNDLIR
jgi:hypothetical protein